MQIYLFQLKVLEIRILVNVPIEKKIILNHPNLEKIIQTFSVSYEN